MAELSRDSVYAARRRWPMLRDRRPEVYGPLTAHDEDARGLLVTAPAAAPAEPRACNAGARAGVRRSGADSSAAATTASLTPR